MVEELGSSVGSLFIRGTNPNHEGLSLSFHDIITSQRPFLQHMNLGVRRNTDVKPVSPYHRSDPNREFLDLLNNDESILPH